MRIQQSNVLEFYPVDYKENFFLVISVKNEIDYYYQFPTKQERTKHYDELVELSKKEKELDVVFEYYKKVILEKIDYLSYTQYVNFILKDKESNI